MRTFSNFLRVVSVGLFTLGASASGVFAQTPVQLGNSTSLRFTKVTAQTAWQMPSTTTNFTWNSTSQKYYGARADGGTPAWFQFRDDGTFLYNSNNSTNGTSSNALYKCFYTISGTTGSADLYWDTAGVRYQFTFVSMSGVLSLAPTVTSVSPNSGYPTGGLSVTISGTNFTGATSVTFGGNQANSFTVDNPTTITAVTPAGSAGVVSIVVTSPNGSGTGANLFTYSATSPVVSHNYSGTIRDSPSATCMNSTWLPGALVNFGLEALKSNGNIADFEEEVTHYRLVGPGFPNGSQSVGVSKNRQTMFNLDSQGVPDPGAISVLRMSLGSCTFGPSWGFGSDALANFWFTQPFRAKISLQVINPSDWERPVRIVGSNGTQLDVMAPPNAVTDFATESIYSKDYEFSVDCDTTHRTLFTDKIADPAADFFRQITLPDISPAVGHWKFLNRSDTMFIGIVVRSSITGIIDTLNVPPASVNGNPGSAFTQKAMQPGEKFTVEFSEVTQWTYTSIPGDIDHHWQFGVTPPVNPGDEPNPDVSEGDGEPAPLFDDPPDPGGQTPPDRGNLISTSVDEEGNTTRYLQDGDKVTAWDYDPKTGTQTGRQLWDGAGANTAPTNATASSIADQQARQINNDSNDRDNRNLSSVAGAGSSAAAGSGNSTAGKSGDDMMENAKQNSPNMPDWDPETMTAPSPNGTNGWIIWIPGVNRSFNFNPMNVPFFVTIATWCKSMIGWMAVLFIARFALAQFFEFQTAVFSANQMQGIDGGAFGGAVSAPTGLVYAAGFLVALGVAVGIFSAIYLEGVGFGWANSIRSLLTLGNANNGGSILAGMYEIVYAFVPLEHLGNILFVYVAILLFKNGALGAIGTTKTLLVK